MPRIFIALDLSPETRIALARLQVAIPGARWLPAEQLHLTLAFIGDLDSAAVEPLKKALAAVKAPGFTLRFTVPGCYPHARQPRVLWYGLEPEPRLTLLAEKVRQAVLSCAIPLEERLFSPHITLARLKQPAGREVSAFLEPTHLHSVPPVDVSEFILFESRLSSGGAIHTPLERFPLPVIPDVGSAVHV
jgi:2'-5' RNA ligase